MKFNLLIYGVKKIWRAHKASIINPAKFKIDVAWKKGSGRKRNISDAVLIARLKDVEFCFQQTIWTLAKKIEMPSSSLYRYLKKGVLKNKRSVVKSMLTPQNKQVQID